METPDRQSKPATIAALAGARALPPLLIVLYHYSEGHHYTGIHILDRVVTRGYLWVEFFFALSGFILTHVHARRAAELWTRKGYFAFLKARLARLYPLHLFMLLLILIFVIVLRQMADAGGYVSIFDLKYHQDVSPKGFVLSLLLMHAWHTMDRLTWNGLSWFVSAEFALCLVFPLILRFAAPGAAWRGVALIGAGIAGMAALLGLGHGLDFTYDWGVPRGLSEFLFGAGLAVLFRAASRRRIPDWALSAAQLALLALLVLSFRFTGWSHSAHDIYTVLPLMLLILALAYDRGVVADLFKARPLQRLGDWSYAVYLGQTAWLLLIRHFANGVYPPGDTIVLGQRFSTLMWWLEPTLLILVCVLWGGALAEWVEKPAGKWLRARLDRPRKTAPASGIS